MPNYQEMTDLAISKEPKDGKEKDKQTEKEKGQEKAEKTDVKEVETPKEKEKGKEHEKAEAEACAKKEKCDVKETEKPKEKGKEHEKKKDLTKKPDSKTGIAIKEIQNEKDLEAKLKKAGGNLIVLDFYANWCMPCKLTGPHVDRLAEEYKDVTFYKVNVDENEALALKYDVSTLPTFLYLKHGKVVETIVGSSIERVEENIKKHRTRLSDGKADKTSGV